MGTRKGTASTGAVVRACLVFLGVGGCGKMIGADFDRPDRRPVVASIADGAAQPVTDGSTLGFELDAGNESDVLREVIPGAAGADGHAPAIGAGNGDDGGVSGASGAVGAGGATSSQGSGGAPGIGGSGSTARGSTFGGSAASGGVGGIDVGSAGGNAAGTGEGGSGGVAGLAAAKDGGTSVESQDAGDAGAEPPGPRCNPRAKFRTPEFIAELSTGDFEQTPRLSPDELQVYFGRRPNEGGIGEDIYVASRTSTSSPFGEPVRLENLSNAAYTEVQLSITADGLTVYVASTARVWKIYRATRTNVNAPFSVPTRVSGGPDSAYHDTTPYISPDGSVLYFSSTRGNGSWRMYRAEHLEGNAFGAAEEVIEFDGVEFCPVVAADELTAFFSSTLAGDVNLYESHREKRTDPWPTPSIISELSTPAEEFGGWISPDGCVLYYSSDGQLYRAQRGF